MPPLDMTYLGIPGYALFWILTLLAFGLFAFRIARLIRCMRLGRKEESFKKLIRRALKTAAVTLGQWCQLKSISLKDRAGIGHIIFAWGFLTFALSYLVFIIIGAGFGLSATLEHSAFYLYYTWILDIVSVLVFAAALWAIIRRYVIRPPRLRGEQTGEALLILLTVLLHPLTHLFKIASAIALSHPPAGLGFALPPVSAALSNIFTNLSLDALQAAHAAFFWAHWLLILGVMLLVAYSRYLHMIASFFNAFFRSQLPKGELRTIDMETAEIFGTARITDFTWKQMLDLYSCVSCGQCQQVCPATASGKPLNPKLLIQDLKQELMQTAPRLLKDKDYKAATVTGGVITSEAIWDCTTCRACDEVCPLYIEHVDKIVDMRRNLVLEQAVIPESAEQALRSIEARGHPWRGATAGRTEWSQGLDIKDMDADCEFLLWVGCSGALEERSINITRSLVKILKQADINFGILGAEESCCGQPARRLGNEYLFQMQAQKNIETLKKYGVKKIITACPHCYNTIKNEYTAFGGEFEVIHHTQLIASLIEEGRLEVKGNNSPITYQDPCYLGRYNDIYKQPRSIIQKLGGLTEMEDSGKKGFCCGGGGGRMWLEEKSGSRINEMRIEQALETGAETIATACPFCLQMLEDAIKTKGCQDSLKALDIAELIAGE